MYHIFYRTKHSSAILNTHFGLSKNSFLCEHTWNRSNSLLASFTKKTVCENWIDLVTLWWEYRFEWVFSTILLRLTFTMKRENESWKRIVALIFGSCFIYESVILYYIAYCIIRKYRLIILWIYFAIFFFFSIKFIIFIL